MSEIQEFWFIIGGIVVWVALDIALWCRVFMMEKAIELLCLTKP